MALNDGSSRQFEASAPSMSTQMNAFATGKGARTLQAAMFALMLVVVVGVVNRRSHGMELATAGFVALCIFGLAGTAYVWWRSRRKVVISVTGDGLTVDHGRTAFPLADAKLGPWVNMGVALHLESGSRRFVLGGRDRRIAPTTQLDAAPAPGVDAWLWAAEFDELLAMGGRQSGLAAGQSTRCLLFPNPLLAEQLGSFALRKQIQLQRSLSQPSLFLDVDNNAMRVIDPNSGALSAAASWADVTATPTTFQPASVSSGDGSTHHYPAVSGLRVSVPGMDSLTIGCLDLVGTEFRFSWRGNVAGSRERPTYVASGADLLALVEKFGLTAQLKDMA
jgi:hypothetical protein